MVRYVALRFAEDANVADRTYWYRCPFPVAEGERVFAPLGAHDRLQRAQVERVLPAQADPPYDVSFLKDVAAKCGAYRRRMGEETLFETGGVAYDGKHFTRYGKVLFGDCEGPLACAFPVAAPDVPEGLHALLKVRGCAVLTGSAAAQAAAVLMLLAGAREGDVRTRLAQCGAEGAFPPGGAASFARFFSEEEFARLAGILR